MIRSSRRLALLVTLGAVLLVACGRRTETSSKPSTGGATRIVSISPSTTEALFAIGAGDRVVGRSRYCDWPPEVLRLPQVGGYVDPSFEAILALSPDLVVGARGPIGTTLTDRLAARGIRTAFPPTESFAAIDEMILTLGRETAHDEEARNVVRSLHADVARVEAAVRGKPRVRALFVFGLSPLSVAGPTSFADEMLKHAGGENVVTTGSAYPSFGVEHVLVLDPDVIVHATMEGPNGPRIGPTSPGWERLRAVREGRVRTLDDETVLRPGPRIGDGVKALARALRPDLDLSRGEKDGGT